jgi:hypothetical protein
MYEDQCYEILLHSEGEENAISASRLAAELSISERELRLIIHAIREDKKYERVVLSGNKGYWIARKEEVEKCVNRLFSQAINTLRISRCIIKKAGLDKQGEFTFKEDDIRFVNSLLENYKNDDTE